jgi:hypothetical protein
MSLTESKAFEPLVKVLERSSLLASAAGVHFQDFRSRELGGTMPSIQTHQTEQADDWMSVEPACWDPKGPITEALRLLALLESGDTVDDVRRLIAIPYHIEASLRAFIITHPEESFEIESMLSFRQEVATAFERIVSMYLVDKGESLCPRAEPNPQRCLGKEMTLH